MNTATVPKIGPHMSRARVAGLPATLSLEDWTRTVADFAGLCAYCNEAPARVVEHFIPLHMGGGTTAGNCLPACMACNASKHGKLPHELSGERFAPRRLEELRVYLRARSTGADIGTPSPTLPPVTGVRIPEDILSDLDAMVEVENTRLAPTGASISRSALIVRLLREAVTRSKNTEGAEPQS